MCTFSLHPWMSENCLWQMGVEDWSCFHVEHIMKAVREQKSINVRSGAKLWLREWKMPVQPPFTLGMISCLHIYILRAEEGFAMSSSETWCTLLNLPCPQVWGCRYEIRNWKRAVCKPSRKMMVCLACRYLFSIKPIVKKTRISIIKRNETPTHILSARDE